SSEPLDELRQPLRLVEREEVPAVWHALGPGTPASTPRKAIPWFWWRAGWTDLKPSPRHAPALRHRCRRGQVDLSDVAAVIHLHQRLRERGIAIEILITPALKRMMMQPASVVRAGIRAVQAGRISVVPGWANKAAVMFTRVTPRWLHQAMFSRIMGDAA